MVDFNVLYNYSPSAEFKYSVYVEELLTRGFDNNPIIGYGDTKQEAFESFSRSLQIFILELTKINKTLDINKMVRVNVLGQPITEDEKYKEYIKMKEKFEEPEEEDG